MGRPGSAASLGPADRGSGTGNGTAGQLLWAEPLSMLRLSVLRGWHRELNSIRPKPAMSALDSSLTPGTGGSTWACLGRVSEALGSLRWILARRPGGHERGGSLGPEGGSIWAMAMSLRTDKRLYLSRSLKVR